MKWLIFFAIGVLLVFLCCGVSGTTKKDQTISAAELLKIIGNKQAVILKDKTIKGDLDLIKVGEGYRLTDKFRKIEIASSLTFIGCIFEGAINGYASDSNGVIQLKFEHNLTFYGCQVKGEVNLRGAEFGEDVNFDHSVFHKNVNLQGVRFDHALTMESVSVAGDLFVQNTVFRDVVSFFQTETGGQFSIQQSDFYHDANFNAMEIHGYFDGSLTRFRAGAFFNYSKFFKTVYIHQSRFTERFELKNSECKLDLDRAKSVFNEDPAFINLKVTRNIRIENATFRSSKPDFSTFAGKDNSISTLGSVYYTANNL